MGHVLSLIAFVQLASLSSIPLTLVTVMTFKNNTWGNAALVAQLVEDEGLRHQVYFDTEGVATIGIGYNLESNTANLSTAELGALRQHGITTERAYSVLNQELEVCENEMDKAIPWWHDLSAPRQRVLMNMCYNLGWPNLSGFHHTLAYLKAGDYEEAARQMLDSLWAKQVGSRALRLSNILKAETEDPVKPYMGGSYLPAAEE
jgi:lysozyme